MPHIRDGFQDELNRIAPNVNLTLRPGALLDRRASGGTILASRELDAAPVPGAPALRSRELNAPLNPNLPVPRSRELGPAGQALGVASIVGQQRRELLDRGQPMLRPTNPQVTEVRQATARLPTLDDRRQGAGLPARTERDSPQVREQRRVQYGENRRKRLESIRQGLPGSRRKDKQREQRLADADRGVVPGMVPGRGEIERQAQEVADFDRLEGERAKLIESGEQERHRTTSVNMATIDAAQRFEGMSQEDAEFWRDLAPTMTEQEFRQRIQRYKRDTADPAKASEAYISLGEESGDIQAEDANWLRAYSKIEGVSRQDVEAESRRMRSAAAARESDLRNEAERKRDIEANRQFLDGMVTQKRINAEQAKLLSTDEMLSASQSEYRQRLNALVPPKQTQNRMTLAEMDRIEPPPPGEFAGERAAETPEEYKARYERALQKWQMTIGRRDAQPQQQQQQQPQAQPAGDMQIFLSPILGREVTLEQIQIEADATGMTVEQVMAELGISVLQEDG